MPSVPTAIARGKAALRDARTALLDTIYPPRCLACMDFTNSAHGLCAACWRDIHFISGAACAKCGAPLVGGTAGGAAGGAAEDGEAGDLCGSCRRHPPAWDRGAAALLYRGAGKRMVLAIKHSDRLDLIGPLAGYMARAGAEVIARADLIAPVPLHWRRLLGRRYNQSAELGRAIARRTGTPALPDLLVRARATKAQRWMNRETRAANQSGAIAANPRRAGIVAGKSVLLIDDVLTTGATLSACTEALRAVDAREVNVLALCRVAFGETDDV